MQCPGCKNEMAEVKTACKYGIPIVLDQCRGCGGVWFDESELYRTQHGAAFEVEKMLNIAKLKKFTEFENKKFICPHDGAKLKEFRDWNFPPSIKVEICPKCGGFWFNHGEFSQFQKTRLKKILAVKEREETEVLKNKNFNKELDSKIFGLMKLYGQMEMEQEKEKAKDLAGTVIYIIYMLLRAIFAKR